MYRRKASKRTQSLVSDTIKDRKQINRKVQGVTQSQTAANSRYLKEAKNDKNWYMQNKQKHEKHIDQIPLPQERWSQC